MRRSASRISRPGYDSDRLIPSYYLDVQQKIRIIPNNTIYQVLRKADHLAMARKHVHLQFAYLTLKTQGVSMRCLSWDLATKSSNQTAQRNPN